MNVISAYMLINKAIPSTGGPYTVRFYDAEDNLIQTDVDIPQDGTAHCTLLDGTFNADNQYFKGWNPAPDIVTKDMDCHPIYGDYVVSIEEIHDSWETICQDNGAHYPLGAYKTLTIAAEWSREELVEEFNGMALQGLYGGSHSKNRYRTVFNALAVKVGEGEDGSTSSWITTAIPIQTDTSKITGETIGEDEEGQYYKYTFQDQMFQLAQGNGLARWDYRDSIARKFLNGLFCDGMPEVIRRHIKSVLKDTQYSVNTRPPYGAAQTQEKIWIPSVKEMCTASGDDILINGAFDAYTQYESNLLKYVQNVAGIAYIKDALRLTLAQRKALFLWNASYGIRLRDVTNDKDGPWGGWQTPWFLGDGAIYNLSTNGRNTNLGWLANTGYAPAQHFIFGFCL